MAYGPDHRRHADALDSLIQVNLVMGPSDEDDKPWRLLLLEDYDELVHAGARQSTGQALSRLSI